MALTLNQLQDMRDTIITALGNPVLEARKSDGSMVQYRTISEAKAALETIDEEIMKTQGGQASMSRLAQHKRGDGPSGPSPAGCSNPWI